VFRYSFVSVSCSSALKYHFEMEPANHPHHPLLQALPLSPAGAQWWLVTPSVMEFENIGFSRVVESLGRFILRHAYWS
jgi:hypothetical protein